MVVYKGKAVYQGIVVGSVHILNKKETVKRKKIEQSNVKAEVERFKAAVFEAQKQIDALYEKALGEVGENGAAIFEVHRMLLEDEDFLDSVRNLIENDLVDAEYAVSVAGDNFAEMFASMDDEYMKARAADIKDISDRVRRCLRKEEENSLSAMPPSVIVAKDLTPSETVRLDKSKVLAFVTEHGSPNSHTSILARTMNIPALINVPFDNNVLKEGMNVVVDGYSGEFIVEPDDITLSAVQERIRKEKEEQNLYLSLKGKENRTKDGKRIKVFANIGSVGDVAYALKNDAEGIGLFRSEFLYLGRDDFPSEEEQYQAYKQVLQIMADKKVVIRTLDIGADKQAEYFGLDREENPAMGLRAIRICLTRPEIFKTQLRALFRAGRYGNLSVMYPMITSVSEVKKIHKIVEEVVTQLKEENIPYKIPEQGIMIETPAAVMISDELAQYVDFFSIGTNDLTQYALAVDRQNENLEAFYDSHHKAILRMIEMTVQNGHKAGIWVGICGELGADVTLTKQFIQMGVDELSVSPSTVLKLRKTILETDCS